MATDRDHNDETIGCRQATVVEQQEDIMKKIISGLFISLDGVAEAPDKWHFPYFNDEMGQAINSQMEETDTVLLGRVTYEAFASYWPHQSSEVPFADYINNTPKYVVSTTLDRVEWKNSTLINGDLVGELKKLKAGPGKNIGITGSILLVRSLIQNDLLDELRLLVHPIVVGNGKRLFVDGMDMKPLKLVESKTFETGVLSLIYQPADA
jgi:dihydrofolate reductase